jgi:predicted amidohydrolase
LVTKPRLLGHIFIHKYAGLEIGDPNTKNDKQLFASIQQKLEQYIGFFQAQAKQNQLYIMPGTIPVEISSGTYVNRAYFFNPNGGYGWQDKLVVVHEQ